MAHQRNRYQQHECNHDFGWPSQVFTPTHAFAPIVRLSVWTDGRATLLDSAINATEGRLAFFEVRKLDLARSRVAPDLTSDQCIRYFQSAICPLLP